MTPMTSRVDIDSLELSKIKEMTISMEIIYGKL
jgi:hypothetical protein